MLGEYGTLIAAEARRKNVYAVLGPTINQYRLSLGGRHFECFFEDSMLTAEMAEAYVAIALPQRAFEHWTPQGWATEPGEFTLHVGGSLADLPLSAQI